MKASVEHIRQKFAFTERRACRLLLVPVSSYRYQPRHNDHSLRERLIALAREKPRFGYRRLHVLLGREGEQVNHKRVHRIYREVGVSAHTIYAWKSKYGGMDVSEAKEAKRLRDENSRLRKLVADLSLDKEALQSVIEKNGWSSQR